MVATANAASGSVAGAWADAVIRHPDNMAMTATIRTWTPAYSKRNCLTQLVLRQILHCAVKILGLGQNRVFEHRLIRAEGVHGSDPPHRRIEPVEKLLADARRDLRAVTPAERIFIVNNYFAGFL